MLQGCDNGDMVASTERQAIGDSPHRWDKSPSGGLFQDVAWQHLHSHHAAAYCHLATLVATC